MKVNHTWWRNAIAGKVGEIHEGHPEQGRYKMRRERMGKFFPVAIWLDKESGKLKAAVAGESADPYKIWTWCAKNPIKEADYKFAIEHGHFPDEPPDLDPAIGDNNPPKDIVDIIPAEIEAAMAWLNRAGEIKTKLDADMASNMATKLRDLKRTAEAEHKLKKAPHLEAGREVDATYKPHIEAAEQASKQLLTAAGKWAAAEKRRLEAEQEAARKAEEARRAADVAKGKPVDDTPLAPPEPVKVQMGGARGRKIGLREYKKAVIVEYDEALTYFAEHPDVVHLIGELAQHAVRDGREVPGVKVEIEMRAQ